MIIPTWLQIVSLGKSQIVDILLQIGEIDITEECEPCEQNLISKGERVSIVETVFNATFSLSENIIKLISGRGGYFKACSIVFQFLKQVTTSGFKNAYNRCLNLAWQEGHFEGNTDYTVVKEGQSVIMGIRSFYWLDEITAITSGFEILVSCLDSGVVDNIFIGNLKNAIISNSVICFGQRTILGEHK